MSKTIYLAGKVSGLHEESVKEKFRRANEELAEQGYIIVNPVSVYKKGDNWHASMRANIRMLLECEELHMLPCWQESKGAQLERDIAMRLGMQVVYH